MEVSQLPKMWKLLEMLGAAAKIYESFQATDDVYKVMVV